MTLSQAVRACFVRYAGFSGRASRAEFWKFVLFFLLTSIVLTAVNSLLFGPTEGVQLVVSVDGDGNQSQGMVQTWSYSGGWLGVAFGVVVLLPFLAVACRRLHDIGRPGWHGLLFPVAAIFMNVALRLNLRPVTVDPAGLDPALGLPAEGMVPTLSGPTFLATWGLAFACLVVTIVWLCRRSEPGPNRFGPSIATQPMTLVQA